MLVSVLTLVSRILGFVREAVAALIFGDKSAIFDAFITAWRIPNLFRRFLGEGAISTALQTRLAEVDTDHGDEAGRQLFWRTVSLVTRLLLIVSATMMVAAAFMPNQMPVTGWNWLGADPEPVRELAIRVMPFVIFICLSALAGGALQVRGHFATPALAPVIMNVCWVGTLLFIFARFAVEGQAPTDPAKQLEMARVLAWGVLVAGALQLFVQVPALGRHGLLRAKPGSTAGIGASELIRGARDVIARSAPLALGAAVYQINVLSDGLMAEGLLPDGGPTAHYLANRVQQFPLALIAVAATSSVFPALKILGHKGERDELRQLHDRTQLGVAFLALPAAAGLFALAAPITSALFEHGSFTAEGVERQAAVLRMLAFALLPAGAVGLTSRSYYAMGDFKTPVRISIWMLVSNILLNLLFVVGFDMDADGLALGTVISSWGNLLLLLPGLVGRLELPGSEPGVLKRLMVQLTAAVLSGASSFYVHSALETQTDLIALAGGIATGAGVYALAALALRMPEAQSLLRRPRR